MYFLNFDASISSSDDPSLSSSSYLLLFRASSRLLFLIKSISVSSSFSSIWMKGLNSLFLTEVFLTELILSLKSPFDLLINFYVTKVLTWTFFSLFGESFLFLFNEVSFLIFYFSFFILYFLFFSKMLFMKTKIASAIDSPTPVQLSISN